MDEVAARLAHQWWVVFRCILCQPVMGGERREMRRNWREGKGEWMGRVRGEGVRGEVVVVRIEGEGRRREMKSERRGEGGEGAG